MFRLIRGVITLGILAGLGYVAVYVPLGERTLRQHLKAIASSPEGKRLVDGVKHKAGEVLDEEKKKGASAGSTRAGQALRPVSRPTPATKATPATKGIKGEGDGFSKEERDALRKLIRARLHPKQGAKAK